MVHSDYSLYDDGIGRTISLRYLRDVNRSIVAVGENPTNMCFTGFVASGILEGAVNLKSFESRKLLFWPPFQAYCFTCAPNNEA